MPIIVEQSQWAGTRAELTAAVAAFGVAKAAHAQTVGVPAPLVDPIVMAVHAAGGEFKLRAEHDAENAPPPPPTPAEIAARELASSDRHMARVTEDLIAALVAKGVIALADLPQEARDRILQRQTWREDLQ